MPTEGGLVKPNSIKLKHPAGLSGRIHSDTCSECKSRSVDNGNISYFHGKATMLEPKIVTHKQCLILSYLSKNAREKQERFWLVKRGLPPRHGGVHYFLRNSF